ncbi:MAG: hypothetical protein HYR85_07905 [Planctomycetes bacterium]|nr:hypothetical protein [Planctomycetota bacterium]
MLHPRAPLVAGTLALLGIAAYLAVFDAAPGGFTSAHAQIPGVSLLGNCDKCHSPAGLAKGCLGCHTEIANEIAAKTGLHGYLSNEGETACGSCHVVHGEKDDPLVGALAWGEKGRSGFTHPHVDFRLVGRHDSLACESCHEIKDMKPFALPAFPALVRSHTFLGLAQDCTRCHADPHAGGLSLDCEECHSQDRFKPAARFDHDTYYPLRGGHATARCDRCHVVTNAGEPGGSLHFKEVRGIRCVECHENPHRVNWGQECESCHANDGTPWTAATARVTPDIHALTGFRIVLPHATVQCEGCHPANLPFAARYPDPRSSDYRRNETHCDGCHADVHKGQFAATHSSCLDCHEATHFVPARFGLAEHVTFALKESHVAAPCGACHEVDAMTQVRTFVPTARECEGCHRDPHDGQFAASPGGCRDCHGETHFTPAHFSVTDHDHTSFPLAGAHAAVSCRSCHRVDSTTAVRRFKDTTRECKACHRNPHGPQFTTELASEDCTACHRAALDTFAIRPFDHAKRTGWALTGAHATATCEACHGVRKSTDARGIVASVRVYRDTPKTCDSCHRDVHMGQFREGENVACESCHPSTRTWNDLAFDHNTQSTFVLDGAHAKVPCQSCHPSVKVAEDRFVIRFKPVGRECKDCHAFPER